MTAGPLGSFVSLRSQNFIETWLFVYLCTFWINTKSNWEHELFPLEPSPHHHHHHYSEGDVLNSIALRRRKKIYFSKIIVRTMSTNRNCFNNGAQNRMSKYSCETSMGLVSASVPRYLEDIKMLFAKSESCFISVREVFII